VDSAGIAVVVKVSNEGRPVVEKKANIKAEPKVSKLDAASSDIAPPEAAPPPQTSNVRIYLMLLLFVLFIAGARGFYVKRKR
jgi:hypothetical protein